MEIRPEYNYEAFEDQLAEATQISTQAAQEREASKLYAEAGNANKVQIAFAPTIQETKDELMQWGKKSLILLAVQRHPDQVGAGVVRGLMKLDKTSLVNQIMGSLV